MARQFPSHRYRSAYHGVAARMLIVQFVFYTSSALASDIKSSSNSVVLNPSLVSTGLRNLGNTCYMNAQLQCAFHIPAVRDIVLTKDVPEEDAQTFDDDDVGPEEDLEMTEISAKPVKVPEPESDALLALRELFQSMIQAADRKMPAVVPRSFCLKLGIPPMVQQDSQEFWKLLLPAVNKEKLSDLYKGSFEDYITALDGSGRERRREELFLDLSLDISSSSTLLESIKASFGEPELLSVAEGNGWRPEKGADKVDAHKGSSLVAKGLPPILQFHLKRFNYDWNTDTTSKLNNRLAFPEELDLSEVCKIENPSETSTTTYDLQSVLIHMGEYGVGHYYSYVRPDIRKDVWYRFNDDIVERVSLQEVLDDAYGGRVTSVKPAQPGDGPFRWFRRLLQNNSGASFGWGGRTSNAYVLQYARRADQAVLYPIDEKENEL